MNDLISIIIPAYNSENTIVKCVSSVQNQTHKNLEIIVVNDGSTDRTADLVNSLKTEDNRIKLIDIPNGGVSHARNVGIDNAQGDYLTFVDSDDYIDKEMYAVLLSIIKAENAKIAHCSYKNVDEKGNLISIVGDKGKTVIQNHDEALECLITGRLFIGGLCNKLYESILFNDVRLNESIKFNEDILANFQLFDKVDKSVYIDKPFYYYVAVAESSTHSANSIMYREQACFVSKEIQRMSAGKSYKKIADSSVAGAYLGLYQALTFSKEKNSKRKTEVRDKVIEFRKQGYYSRRDKLVYVVCRFFPHITPKVYKLYDKIRKKNLDPEQ